MPVKLSALTIRRLRRVAEIIVAKPDSYDQGEGGSGNGLNHKGRSEESCDTAVCILGWANILFPAASTGVRGALAERCGGYRDAHDRVVHAAARLRLSVERAERLWVTDKWPTKFYRARYRLKSARAIARNAARRIEHFIETNGEE